MGLDWWFVTGYCCCPFVLKEETGCCDGSSSSCGDDARRVYLVVAEVDGNMFCLCFFFFYRFVCFFRLLLVSLSGFGWTKSSNVKCHQELSLTIQPAPMTGGGDGGFWDVFCLMGYVSATIPRARQIQRRYNPRHCEKTRFGTVPRLRIHAVLANTDAWSPHSRNTSQATYSS